MRERRARIDLATGFFIDVDTGEVYKTRRAWEGAVRAWYRSIWNEANANADPADEVEFSLPKKVSETDLRWQLYKDDELINPRQGRTRGNDGTFGSGGGLGQPIG